MVAISFFCPRGFEFEFRSRVPLAESTVVLTLLLILIMIFQSRTRTTFSQTGTFDEDAVNICTLAVGKAMADNPFSDNEVNAAVRKMANGKISRRRSVPSGVL